MHFCVLSNLKTEAGLLSKFSQFDLENNKSGDRSGRKVGVVVSACNSSASCAAGESGIQGHPLGYKRQTINQSHKKRKTVQLRKDT